MRQKVLCLGFAVVDVTVLGAPPAGQDFASGDTQPVADIAARSGGDALNQAVTLKGLGHDPLLHVPVGDDLLTDVLCACVSRHGITEKMVRVPGRHSATSVPIVDLQGGRRFFYNPGCLEDIQLSQFDLGLLAETKLLSVGSFLVSPLLDREIFPAFLRDARTRSIPTVADCNADVFGVGPRGVRENLPFIDYFLPSLSEAAYLAGTDSLADMAKAFKDWGARNVVIKLGEQGCYLDCHDFVGLVPAITAPKVVDTTGAGDAFVGAFICGLLQGWPAEKSARFAVVVGGASIGFAGANTYMLHQEHIRGFLAQHGWAEALAEIEQKGVSSLTE